MSKKHWLKSLALLAVFTLFAFQAKADKVDEISANANNISNTYYNGDYGYMTYKILVADNYGGGENMYIRSMQLSLGETSIGNVGLAVGSKAGDGDWKDVFSNIYMNALIYCYGYRETGGTGSNYSTATWHSFNLYPYNYYTIKKENSRYYYANIRYFPFIEFETATSSVSLTAKMSNINVRWEYDNNDKPVAVKTKTLTFSRPFNISAFTLEIDEYGRLAYKATTNYTVRNRNLYYNGGSSIQSIAGSGSSTTGVLDFKEDYYLNSGTVKFRAQKDNHDYSSRVYVYKETSVPNIALFNSGLTATNQGDGTIKLSWKTKNPESNTYLNRVFKIFRRIDGGAWESCGTESWTVSKIDYSYTYTIPESERGLGSRNYEFKVVRDGIEQATHSFFHIASSLDVNTDYACADDLIFDQPLRRIYFKEIPGIKPGNFSFVITALEKGASSARTISNITSTSSYDLYAIQGYSYWFDSGINGCVPTTYTIQGKLGTDEKNKKSITVLYEPEAKRDVTSFSASKGYYNDRVELKWTVPADASEFSSFKILRYVLDDPTGQSLFKAYEAKYDPSQRTVETTDRNVSAGTFYRYELYGIASCADETVETLMKTDFGYAQAFGQVNGKVTFTGTSTGVPDVDIKFENTSPSDINGVNRSVDLRTNGHLSAPAPYGSSAQFTYQMWTKLRETKQQGKAHTLLNAVQQTTALESVQDTIPEIGSIVYYGSYPQIELGKMDEIEPEGVFGKDYIHKEKIVDGISHGYYYYSLAPIAWKVTSDATEGRLMLVAENVLDSKKYDTSQSNVTWEKSSIRKWLNDLSGNPEENSTKWDSFLGAAFTSDEQKSIYEATI
ncbi:DUF6273 domain-containing protein, partial [Bacteroidales bacterium OttesenSCG-928-L03]|nr:DUF6273 domain-containing protein [Bacteroidales bacterium OttesenSCG-928-L03]